MAGNEQILLEQVLKEQQDARDTPLKEDDAFELFACEQALRDQDLSTEEVAAGVVGGSNDGAIDGLYVFLGDVLLVEDDELLSDEIPATKVTKGTHLTLWLVQAKRETSFTETAFDKVADSTRRLLDLGEDDDVLSALYSPALLSAVGVFRAALQKFATRHLQVEVRFSYATRGASNTINGKVVVKAQELEKQFRDVVSGATGTVEFLGAAELWERYNRVTSYTTQLTYKESATSGTSHIALVTLRDYVDFLSDEGGALRRHIFDWNVRDYQGDVEVNKEIRQSLVSDDAPEFWWLNNGVTIVCSKASSTGKTYALDDVQIVNGLQTSQTIFRVLSEAAPDSSAFDRSVLVRILVTGDDLATRDRVIRATNRQTSVPAASLRATDEIQRNIESFFLGHGWFYDRRKNFYRNIGKSPERIVGIPLLAQAVMAMGLSRPDNSRARPSSLLKRDEDYQKIFSDKIPLTTYLWLAKAQKAVDSFLSSEAAGIATHERTNLRFHLAMLAATRLVDSRVYAPQQLSAAVNDGRSITDADLSSCLEHLRSSLASYAEKTGDAADKVFKGPDFVEYLFDHDHDQEQTGESPNT